MRLYCEENSLTVKIEKTNIVIFKRGGSDAKNLRFLYSHSEIKMVWKYTHLSVTFDERGLLSGAAEEFFRKANIALQATIKVINRANINRMQRINKLFVSLVASILENSSQILWALRHLEELEQTSNGLLQKIDASPK